MEKIGTSLDHVDPKLQMRSLAQATSTTSKIESSSKKSLDGTKLGLRVQEISKQPQPNLHDEEGRIDDAEQGRLEVASTYFDGANESPEDFRKELERLQIATIFSLVETIPTRDGGHLNLLFLTNNQAAEFDFTDIDKVMTAMDIKPKPKLVVTIFKSMFHMGGTSFRDSQFFADTMFTPHCYVSENNVDDMIQSERRITLFLKEQLLPVCIKTNALVFLHDSTCSISVTSECSAQVSVQSATETFRLP